MPCHRIRQMPCHCVRCVSIGLHLLHAAQTSPQSAGHEVLQRHLARDALLFGITGHSLHHRRGTADLDHIEMFLLQHAVVGHKTLLTHRAILGSHQHTSVFLKLAEHQQILGGTGAQEERGFQALLLQRLAQIEQRRHTYATTNQKRPVPCDSIAGIHCRVSCDIVAGNRKAITQRQHAVQRIACLQLSQPTGAVAHTGYQQPQLVGISVHEINRDRTAQEGSR